MAIIYANSCDHYGGLVGTKLDTGNAVSFPWPAPGEEPHFGDGWSSFPQLDRSDLSGDGFYSFSVPTWGARRGERALVCNAARVESASPAVAGTFGNTDAHNIIIPGASNHVRRIHLAFSMEFLPTETGGQGWICTFLDGGGQPRAGLFVTPSGRLILTDGTLRTINDNGIGNVLPVLLTSAGPVVQPQTWYFLSIEITTNAVDGNADFDLYVGDINPGNLILSGTALVFTDTGGGTRFVEILGLLPINVDRVGSVAPPISAVRDIVFSDASGTYNTTLLGPCFVSAQDMETVEAGGGWIPQPRENFTEGILDCLNQQGGLFCADSGDFDLGAADFTIESMVRFHTLPLSSTESTIVGKWRTDTSNRSYKLVYAAVDGTLRWVISTDGSATVTVKTLPWAPDLNRWYHITVARNSALTSIYIDGVELGVPLADSNSYFASDAALGVGGQFDGTSTLIADTSFDGFLDETRITVGVARYTTDFTPPAAAFGRNIGADPSFASVQLLLGYEAGLIVDESGAARTVSNSGSLVAIIPGDNDSAEDVLIQRPFLDDSFIKAPNTFSEGILTLTGLPLDTETTTVGSQVYTWLDTVGAADTIHIGATVAECISNFTAAVNAGAGAGTDYGIGTVANTSATAITFISPQVILAAISIGDTGNSVATTETLTNGSFKTATLEGGLDIPAASDFAVERLDNDVTGVLAAIVTFRNSKSDAGSSAMRVDLIGPSAGVATGALLSPALNASWARQVFEEDPDTSASLTPSTLASGRVRFTRTT